MYGAQFKEPKIFGNSSCFFFGELLSCNAISKTVPSSGPQHLDCDDIATDEVCGQASHKD